MKFLTITIRPTRALPVVHMRAVWRFAQSGQESQQ